MFNVYDPKSVMRGSVPVQRLPRDEEVKLLRGLANPSDPNVPAETRAAAQKALLKLSKESREYQRNIRMAFLLLRLLRREDRESRSTENQEAARLLEKDMEAAHDVHQFGPPPVQDWEVYVCQLPSHIHRTRHIVGRVGRYREVIVTSALISINTDTGEAETETGEIYVFGGQVQGSPVCDSVFASWRDKEGATAIERITMEVRDSLLSKREHKE
jgi:hypothetical protein